MYDISQLNDLLVPELHDIADQLHINNSKKLHKQDLINSILDKQAIMTADKTQINGEEKPRRKRIAKTPPPNAAEVAVVAEAVDETLDPSRQARKKPIKKAKVMHQEGSEVSTTEQPVQKRGRRGRRNKAINRCRFNHTFSYCAITCSRG